MVISDLAEVRPAILEVENEEPSHDSALARLPDAAGVQEVTLSLVELHGAASADQEGPSSIAVCQGLVDVAEHEGV
jgi:hypothetical protein